METSKITIEKALSGYTDRELIDFHANLNAIQLLTDSENVSVFSLLKEVTLKLQKRGANEYLKSVSELS